MNLAETERQKYQDIWSFPEYHRYSPGAESVDVFLNMIGETPDSVTDFGCGAGAGARALKDAGVKTVNAVDLVDVRRDIDDVRFLQMPLWGAELSHHLLPRCQYGYCVDVMEHIPTGMVGLCVANMLNCCRDGLFLSISFQPDGHGVLVGQPLHLTVQKFHWWLNLLREIGNIRFAVDLVHEGRFLVERVR